ncbi:hypothetical protein [Kitasatospora paracochleata]|uniref:Secreted protein n=1 Tax=Kitasatospora paracochleata TaxID=58354 RepID=A0ABT1JA55_9ACTN|nr:hypothetical protein [Kitasatospora paracochleata]MCP2313948.1 hypothetical protein [Kitasatospora paracochleata]
MMIKIPRRLPEIAAFAVLAGGLALLVTPGAAGHRPEAVTTGTRTPSAPAPARPPDSAALPTPPAAEMASATASPTGTPVAGAPSPSPATERDVMPSGVPAAGDGPDADTALQAAFSRQKPSDLAPVDAEQLTSQARAVWTAETTGVGRDRWPLYFPATTGAGRLYLYTDVRVQAAAAHTVDGSADKARVDLLWAGTSATGSYGDSRPATLTFTRTSTGWEPVR